MNELGALQLPEHLSSLGTREHGCFFGEAIPAALSKILCWISAAWAIGKMEVSGGFLCFWWASNCLCPCVWDSLLRSGWKHSEEPAQFWRKGLAALVSLISFAMEEKINIPCSANFNSSISFYSLSAPLPLPHSPPWPSENQKWTQLCGFLLRNVRYEQVLFGILEFLWGSLCHLPHVWLLRKWSDHLHTGVGKGKAGQDPGPSPL